LLGFGFCADWMAFFTFAGADCVTTGFAVLVAFFRAAHLAFCAAAIRAFPALSSASTASNVRACCNCEICLSIAARI
jgi:hypothetical protein